MKKKEDERKEKRGNGLVKQRKSKRERDASVEALRE